MTTETHIGYAAVQLGSGRFRRWEVNGPGLRRPAAFPAAALANRAAARLAVLARNEDAWAFELEQVSHISMTRIAQIGDDLRGYGNLIGCHKWVDMTPAQRVRALVVAGHARYAFDERMGHHSASFSVCLARGQMNASMQRRMDAIDGLAVRGHAIVETTEEKQA